VTQEKLVLFLVVFPTAGVTNRDLNAMGCDIRGAIAIAPGGGMA
jgi:hypothetical protein